MSEADQGLKDRVTADMKSALRAQEKERLGTLRLILAAVKQREIDEQIALDDTQVLAVLEKMIKQRRDAIGQYESAGRQDLADRERFEVQVIQEYMPTALSEAEVDALIEEAIAAIGAGSMQDMGKVMSQLKPRLQGRADMAAVSNRVKARLST